MSSLDRAYEPTLYAIHVMSDQSSPPESTRAHTEARVAFDCPECGAALAWDPEADALACEHCGHRAPVPRCEDAIVESPLDAAGADASGLGVGERVARCERCGARVAFGGVETATVCPFCGSARVLPQQANRNAIRPAALIPLDVSATEVEERFRRWIAGLWFRPRALRRQARRLAATGVYVPAWTFDCEADSSWSADAGHYYFETVPVMVTVGGRRVPRTRRVRRIRWVPASGRRHDRYDDLQVIASRGVPAELASRLLPYDTSALVPYRPEFLAGWRAEEYQLDLAQGWARARERIETRQRERCAADVPGDTHRRLRVHSVLEEVRWKHVLLPLWTLTYDFRGRSYAVLVHGQNGRVVGDAPLSFAKIAALVAVVAAVIAAIWLAVG